MFKKATTSTGFIILGLSAWANPTTSTISSVMLCSGSHELVAAEAQHNPPEISELRIASYVDSKYSTQYNILDNYKSIDFAWLSIAQNFARHQTELEPDFVNALNELAISKTNKIPKKPRFK